MRNIVKIKKINHLYTIGMPFLFFLFFVSPALSPALGGKTVYLYWLVALLDGQFIKFLYRNIKRKQNNRYILAMAAILLLCIGYGRFFIAIKACSIFLCIAYLSYAQRKYVFKYLYIAMNINIIIAALQFILFYVNRDMAYTIGPTNISKLIWGKHATETYTNMYSIWGNELIRVSGLSREAGFFATLLTIVFFCYIYDDSVKKSKKQYAIFIGGFAISFSKASLMVLPMFLVFKFSKYINKIPRYGMDIIYLVVTTAAARFLDGIGYFLPQNESITHRFIGYHVVWELRGTSAVFGFGTLEKVGEDIMLRNKMLEHLALRGYDLCGWANLVEYFGFIGLGIWFIILGYLGVNTSGMIFIMLATFTVNPLTATSFVVLAYWMALGNKGVQ